MGGQCDFNKPQGRSIQFSHFQISNIIRIDIRQLVGKLSVCWAQNL